MNNINPIDIIINSFSLLNILSNLNYELVVTTNDLGIINSWHTKKEPYRYIIYTEDEFFEEYFNLNDIIDFFKTKTINEITSFNITQGNHIELYLCEGDDCYYERSKKSDIIKKSWKARKFRQSAKQGLIKNRVHGQILEAPPKQFNKYFPGGTDLLRKMKETENDKFRFGKSKISFNSLKKVNQEIKYLKIKKF